VTPLEAQFLAEAREILEAAGAKLLDLEDSPTDAAMMNELFRLVHTLKGNSGLFEYPEMTRVLHVAEDLMDSVRNRRIPYNQGLADHLFEAFDFVGLLCGDLEADSRFESVRAGESTRLTHVLRELLAASAPGSAAARDLVPTEKPTAEFSPDDLSEGTVAEALARAPLGSTIVQVVYQPNPDCFFQGTDPFHTVRTVPGILWGRIRVHEPLGPLGELNAYRNHLTYEVLSAAPEADLADHFRYVAEEVSFHTVARAPGSSQTEGDVLAAQRRILLLEDNPGWKVGRWRSVAAVLAAVARAQGRVEAEGHVQGTLDQALASDSSAPLIALVDRLQSAPAPEDRPTEATPAEDPGDEGPKFQRRVEDQHPPRTLRVDQSKIDRLMDLIGEMVVAKNALPFLAQKAEDQFGVRELSREIKVQYGVIHRIASELQDAILQVRMLPMSFVFQRFPRLVREISRKLGKEVQLVLEGEETEADKNIIGALSDPLMHLVRNSLDHGFESPEGRRTAGKPLSGTLAIRASQEADRVVIEIQDDGKGINPSAVKAKALQRGLIDQAVHDRMDDREAVNLVFAAGLSTAETVSDLSGRGVGMDVVKSAVEKINGTVVLDSEVGKGTVIRLSLPLSMAMTQVMVVTADSQRFAIPMDQVVETVRVPQDQVRRIKQNRTTVLRGQVVPLQALHRSLGLAAEPRMNEDGEWAVLVIRLGVATVGMLVDTFEGTIDVIQKPLDGVLAALGAYSGSALLGDGSVLMVLNLKELL